MNTQIQKYLDQRKENPDPKFDYQGIQRWLAEEYLDSVQMAGLDPKETLQLASPR